MNEILLIESPIQMITGETITYSVTWQGASNLSDPSAVVYRGGTDISAAVMTSGVHTVSGNVQTLKALTAAESDGGKKYVVVIECVVDGNTERRKLIVEIVKGAAEG